MLYTTLYNIVHLITLQNRVVKPYAYFFSSKTLRKLKITSFQYNYDSQFYLEYISIILKIILYINIIQLRGFLLVQILTKRLMYWIYDDESFIYFFQSSHSQVVKMLQFFCLRIFSSIKLTNAYTLFEYKVKKF